MGLATPTGLQTQLLQTRSNLGIALISLFVLQCDWMDHLRNRYTPRTEIVRVKYLNDPASWPSSGVSALVRFDRPRPQLLLLLYTTEPRLDGKPPSDRNNWWSPIRLCHTLRRIPVDETEFPPGIFADLPFCKPFVWMTQEQTAQLSPFARDTYIGTSKRAWSI